MSLLTIIILGFGLAMDSFAVSVTNGAVIRPFRVGIVVKTAAVFGAFHIMMPVVGWYGGMSLRSFISGFDHWIAFGLLLLVGGKMLYESVRGVEEGVRKLDWMTLLVLAVATSIDALAIGVSFAFLGVESVWKPAAIIGAVIFVMTFCGFFIGKKAGGLLGKKAEIVGGLVLIGLGVKILLEHLLA